DVLSNPYYKDITAAALDNAIWLNRRNTGVPTFSDDVEIITESFVNSDEHISKTFYRFNGMELWTENRLGGSGGPKTRKMINSEEELEIFSKFPLFPTEKISEVLNPQLENIRKEAVEFPDELGLMMLDLGEPIGVIYYSSNLEEMSIWSLTCPDLVVSILDNLMIRYREIYRIAIESNAAPVFFSVGSELASPPMVSVDTFRRWIVPYAAEINKMIHDDNKWIIQHYHGQIKEILPYFLDMAPDALHTIEAPPIGNCTFTEAFNIVGDKIGLIGNIQYDEFQRLTPDEMEMAVKNVIDECKGKRLMLSPSAGPYEAVLTSRQQENYLRFIQAGVKYG
ncbi:MAG: uroporphyrinogen decarboxylase family protein, partial [bacterium]